MSAGVSSGGSNSQDFELNLASIIDCFTVLIAFMLVSASFLSIGILDAGVAAAGAQQATNTPPPPVMITVELGLDHSMTVKVTGKANQNFKIDAKGQDRDYERLTQQLIALKNQWPEVTAATLNADNAVEYKEVIQSMEVTRKTLPAVMLGGF